MMKLFLSILIFTSTSALFSQVWQPLGSGTDNGGQGIRIKSYQGKLIAAGSFSNAGGVYTKGYAAWDGNVWNAVDEDLNIFFSGGVMAIYHDELYSFGEFYWDSTLMLRLDHDFKWHPRPDYRITRNGYGGIAKCIAVFNDELYVGGIFDKIGDVEAKNIARWDGNSWHAVGTGLNDYPIDMKVYNGKLYVSGQFNQAGGQYAKKLASWDGSQWSNVGNGLEQGNFITCMEVYKEKLYLGGLFTQMGGQATTNIASWDGFSFQPVGQGAGNPNSNDFIAGMGLFMDKLYVGGYFSLSTGVFINDGGVWDGNQWDSLPRGLSSGANSFEYYDCHLYVGGAFTNINGVAKLDVYDCTMDVNEPPKDTPLSAYPNPTDGQVFVNFKVGESVMLNLYDISGKMILSKSVQTPSTVQGLDLSTLPQGIYVLKVISDGKVNTTKVVKQ